MSGPRGAGAHIHVHAQIRATATGSEPNPGTASVLTSSREEKARGTSATVIRLSPYDLRSRAFKPFANGTVASA